MSIPAMKQALETFERMNHEDSIFAGEFDGVIAALRTAIAEAEKQEPVAYFDAQERGFYWAKPTVNKVPKSINTPPIPLYTTPPAAQHQPVGYAGVTMWVGDKTVTQLVTEAAITHERVPGMNMTHTANKCFSLLGVPQRQWVGLTVREIEWCFDDANDDHIVAAWNIEAKLKEKNT